MELSKNFKIEAETYASQGNAILGIRDSGKSYTGTAIAEKLLDAGIPFVAFDPIGIWRYLKIGKNGAGYPVVVAGDGGDLPLTVESAPVILRAAMQNNVPLIIDLYSMKLSKSDWKRIVESCVRLMLYENKKYGLRHIFIEEAAEFCPQRVGPDSGKVYAEIEKLARMGGNASLGYTLINQRAEEVNKAVLELCDCLFLHRQKGRHSLTALGKWMDVGDVESSREIIKSLPTLSQGECWVWEQGSQTPVRIKVSAKKTVHPDRRNPDKTAKGVTTDVSAFLAKMKTTIDQIKTPKPDPKIIEKARNLFGGELAPQQSDNEPLLGEIRALKSEISRMNAVISSIRKEFLPQYAVLKKIFETTEAISSSSDTNWSVWLDKLHGKNRDMLRVLIDKKRLTRQQLGFQIGMAQSGSFSTYVSKLKSLGLVEVSGGVISLREDVI